MGRTDAGHTGAGRHCQVLQGRQPAGLEPAVMKGTTTMKNLILAVFLAPAAALAGGYGVPNVTARDRAMVGSRVAAQDSAAATFQTPAALAKLDGLNLSADLS